MKISELPEPKMSIIGRFVQALDSARDIRPAPLGIGVTSIITEMQKRHPAEFALLMEAIYEVAEGESGAVKSSSADLAAWIATGEDMEEALED